MDFLNKKINLGSGNRIKQGEDWVNHDYWFHRPEIDAAWDLNVFPYPWADDTFKEIRMVDVLEHLSKPLLVINELHRILQPEHTLYMRIVGENSETKWVDPTHERPFNVHSFDFLDVNTERGDIFGFYSQRKWEILHVEEDEAKSIVIEMKKCIKKEEPYQNDTIPQ